MASSSTATSASVLGKLDPSKSAMLTLDFQSGIISRFPNAEPAVAMAAKAVAFARQHKFLLIHVGLGFSPSYAEIPKDPANPFHKAMMSNLFIKVSPSAAFHPSICQAEDIVVYKQRFGAFSENELNLILRSRGIQNLVFFGFSTSGITLTTIRQAFDLDYKCVVLKDCCMDSKEEVHRILIDVVFPSQATVLDTDAFISSQTS